MTGDKRVTILVLAAGPRDRAQIEVAREVRDMDARLRESALRDRFHIEQKWAVRISDLQKHLLQQRPALVHFSGHGNEHGELVVEDDAGEGVPVPPDALEALFAILGASLRCVVLNACHSAEQARAIAKHVDVVVGMAARVGDADAIAFGNAFYGALFEGRTLLEAFELGRVQLKLDGSEFADAPQIHVREGIAADRLRLLPKDDLPPATVPAPATAPPAATRRFLAPAIFAITGVALAASIALRPPTPKCPAGRVDVDEICVSHAYADFIACVRGAGLANAAKEARAAGRASLDDRSVDLDAAESIVRRYTPLNDDNRAAVLRGCRDGLALQIGLPTAAPPTGAPNHAGTVTAVPDAAAPGSVTPSGGAGVAKKKPSVDVAPSCGPTFRPTPGLLGTWDAVCSCGGAIKELRYNVFGAEDGVAKGRSEMAARHWSCP
jgi:hypothetical protein